MSQLLSREQAAMYLGISVRTLDRKRMDGQIPYISECKHARVRFFEKDLNRYLATYRRGGQTCRNMER